MPDTEQSDVTTLTVQLLSAYLGNNTVAPAELAELIRSTRTVLSESPTPIEPTPEVHTPAVSVRKSLANPEHIISLIDGKPYKTLKRHLASHDLTPETYRQRYNLPVNYPMVAPAFAEKRRAIAEAIGLGQRRKGTGAKTSAPTSAPAADDAPVSPAKPAAEPKPNARKTASKRRPRNADEATSQNKTASAAVQKDAVATPANKPKKSRSAVKAKAAFAPSAAVETSASGEPNRGRGKLKLKLSDAEAPENSTSNATTSERGSENAPSTATAKKPARRMARAKTEGAKDKT